MITSVRLPVKSELADLEHASLEMVRNISVICLNDVENMTRKTSSNSSLVCYVYFCTNAPGKVLTPSLLPPIFSGWQPL